MAEKAIYKRPTLTVFGSVSELTSSGTGTSVEDKPLSCGAGFSPNASPGQRC